MNREFQEKAESYLLGKMSSTEAVEFKKLLGDNEELHEEFLVISDINKHFSGDTSIVDIPQNESAEKLRTFIRSEDAANIKNEIVKARNFYEKENSNSKTYLRIAASFVFILLVSIGIYFSSNRNEKNLYVSFYTPTDLPSMISRGSDETTISKAIVAFQNEDYQSALDLLESSEAIKNSNEVAILLHHGIMYLEVGNLNGAIDKFNKVIDSDSIDKTKGFWFKALAYLKAKENENAKLILQEISDNPDFFNHTKAKQLLQKISS